MPQLQLANEDARIVALAIAYHLARPGSETDAETLQPHGLGLGPVGGALDPQLERARVELDVTPYQLHRLDEALLGIANELKQYEMSQRRSAVPRFAEAVGLLFPELGVDRDPSASAFDLVERVVLLRRRLAEAVRAAEASLQQAHEGSAEQPEHDERPWWRFWR